MECSRPKYSHQWGWRVSGGDGYALLLVPSVWYSISRGYNSGRLTAGSAYSPTTAAVPVLGASCLIRKMYSVSTTTQHIGAITSVFQKKKWRHGGEWGRLSGMSKSHQANSGPARCLEQVMGFSGPDLELLALHRCLLNSFDLV